MHYKKHEIRGNLGSFATYLAHIRIGMVKIKAGRAKTS